jgi:hypothetical protein
MDAYTDKPPPQEVNKHVYLFISMNISLTDWCIDRKNYLNIPAWLFMIW